MRVDTLAHRKRQAATTHQLANEMGRHVPDPLADGIAMTRTQRLKYEAEQVERLLNQLYRGRHDFTLPGLGHDELKQFIAICGRSAETAREILAAQEPAPVAKLEAAK